MDNIDEEPDIADSQLAAAVLLMWNFCCHQSRIEYRHAGRWEIISQDTMAICRNGCCGSLSAAMGWPMSAGVGGERCRGRPHHCM